MKRIYLPQVFLDESEPAIGPTWKSRHSLYPSLFAADTGEGFGSIPSDDNGTPIFRWTLVYIGPDAQARVNADLNGFPGFPILQYGVRMSEISPAERVAIVALLDRYVIDRTWITGDHTFGDIITYVGRLLDPAFDIAAWPLA